MKKSRISTRFFGVPGGNRTHGLSLRRRTLYPTELRKQAILIFFKFYTSIYTSNGSDHNILISCLPKPQYVVVCSGCGCRLGGERSILLSYGNKILLLIDYTIFQIGNQQINSKLSDIRLSLYKEVDK